VNNRQGWKGLPGTNTLAYYENLPITAVKSFIGLAHGALVMGDDVALLEGREPSFKGKAQYSRPPCAN
jgi:hypothetical protein